MVIGAGLEDDVSPGAFWFEICEPQLTRDTIMFMQFAIFAMRAFEVLFFCGLAGSAVVVIISFVEDAKELFGED